MGVILVFLVIMALSYTINKVVTVEGAVKKRVRCYEVGVPHKWEKKIQPGFEEYEKQPEYLQCKNCLMIFGDE